MAAKPRKQRPAVHGASLINTLLQRQRSKAITPLPFVSVVCPTFNRREFLPYLIYLYQYQDYPADKRELVILDDSPQSSQDLVDRMVDKARHQVRYIHSPQRLRLGEKRNRLNDLARGEYIISFDDDDYYPPDKLSYQVGEMQRNNANFSGSDQIYIWYSHLNKIYLTQAFGPRHALNGTFGLHRNFLRTHRYQDEATLAEEVAFLKNFTAPVQQIDPTKAILCISHSSNTYDKDFVIGNAQPVDLQLEDFVKDANLLAHYRRLCHAPLNTRVNWSVFDKVALIHDAGEEAMLVERCTALKDFGIHHEQLLLVPRPVGKPSHLAELLAHCSALEQAQQQNWKNLLLLDANISFVRKEISVKNVNALLDRLDGIDWQVLLLGGSYLKLAPLKALPGVARLVYGGCASAYAVHKNYISLLLQVYREAIKQDARIDSAWPKLMQQHCWLGFNPSFAFLQQARDEKTGEIIDCTHWYFRKDPKQIIEIERAERSASDESD